MAPLSDKLYWTAVIALSIIGAAVAVVLLRPHPKPVVETAKPAVVQSDNSIILERTDTQSSVKPVHQIPKGSTVERVVQVKVKPMVQIEDVRVADGISQVEDRLPNPQPITVDMTLVRQPDDTRRVIASSPDGEIVGGLDIPVETLAYKPRVWAAGISVDPVHQVGGVWIERDISRIRLGAEVGANRYHDFETRLKVGVTW